MHNLVISLRGTHGSGKSTVVRQLLERYDWVPEGVDGKDRPENYRLETLYGPLYVVGSYVNTCGGCDAIQPYSLIWPRIEAFEKKGHVLFEGALVSSSYGNIGRESERYGDRMVFAFLDTPLEVCLERIRQRRAAKGNFKPLDPKNTAGKYNSIMKGLPKIRDEFKRRCVMINHRRPVLDVLELLRRG